MYTYIPKVANGEKPQPVEINAASDAEAKERAMGRGPGILHKKVPPEQGKTWRGRMEEILKID